MGAGRCASAAGPACAAADFRSKNTIATPVGRVPMRAGFAIARGCRQSDEAAVTRSPWLNLGHVRLTAPDETTLRTIWEREETIKGVARQLGISVNTAAVWLADVGIFIKDAPVISRRDLQDAIDKRLSVADICRQHHVTGRTVAVELRRHGLLKAHKERHLR